MSYTPKQQGNSGNSGSSGGPGQPNQQTAKVLAGIQQQMQNLVHGQNATAGSPAASINALMALRQQQQHQQFESMIKQQQLVQQFQQQIQQNVAGVSGGTSGGKEPLALTRTPAAAELLNKTLQQQANGSTVVSGGGSGVSGSVSSAASTVVATAQQFQQQLQALAQNPGNIMQQLQAYHHQMAQQQQHQQYQTNRLPPQQQFQSQQQSVAVGVSSPQQQVPQQQHHVQNYPQTNYQHQQQQKILVAAAAAVASKTPTIGGPIKPPTLPAATQITPIPATSVASTAQQQCNNNYSSNKNLTKPTQHQSLPSSISSRPIATQQQQQQSSSTSVLPVTKSPVLGNRATISPISSIASAAGHHQQKNSSSIQSNSLTNIKHQSVSSKLPPPTQITAVPLTKPIVATSSPAKANLLSTNLPKGASIPSSALNITKSTVTSALPAVANNNSSNNEISKISSSQQVTKPAAVVSNQNKIPPIINPATTSTSSSAAAPIVVSSATSPSTLTITPIPVVIPIITTAVTSIASTPPTLVAVQPPLKKDKIIVTATKDLIVTQEQPESKPNIATVVENIIRSPDKLNEKTTGKLTTKDEKLNETKKSEIKSIDEKKVETKLEINESSKHDITNEINTGTKESQIVLEPSVSQTIEKPSKTTIIKNEELKTETPIKEDLSTSPARKTILDATIKVSNEKNEDDSKKCNTVIETSSSAIGKSAKEKNVKTEIKNSSTTIRGNQKKKTVDTVKTEKVDKKEKKINSSTTASSKEPSRLRQTPKTHTPPSAITGDDVGIDGKTPETPKNNDGRTKRHRLKTILYQSPLPELAFITKLSASEASNSPKPGQSNEDKLIVFYKNEFLAVRNADGGFFLCQTMQNVYKTSPKIRIRWLSEEKKDTSIYIPDFYDHTDIECVLTTVDLGKVNKERLRLPANEKDRIENILKKAIDVEKGILPRPDVTEENPDGLDISLYKNESQIEKKSSKKRAASKSPKRTAQLRSGSKSPKKKKNSKSQRKSNTNEDGINSDDDDEHDEEDQYDTDDETEEEEYKPSQKKTAAQQLVKVRAQRSPLARARAVSPITMKNQDQTSKTVPPKNTKSDDVKVATSRNDRAKRRATDTSSASAEDLIPLKKSVITSQLTNSQKKESAKISGNSKTKSDDDDDDDDNEPLVLPTEKIKELPAANSNRAASKTVTNTTVCKKTTSNISIDKMSTITSPSSSSGGRPTRSRK